MAILGTEIDKITTTYDEKKVITKGLGGDPVKELAKMGVSVACKKGMKPESPNQDDFSIHF